MINVSIPSPADACEDIVLQAFKAGYRHIDSARAYRNEQPCADAIRSSGIAREELFFTSKVPPRAMGYDATKAAIESSFKQTGLDYIDLYLIHAPYGGAEARKGTWRALLEAKKAGKIRSLGVSNYGVHHLKELESYISGLEAEHGPGAGGEISVGQWEIHPWLPRPDIVSWCKEKGVVIEAYCPIVRGQRFQDENVQKLVKKYEGKTPAQILLRWSLQRGLVPLVKSANNERIIENAGIFGWGLDGEDVEALATDKYEPISWDPTTSTE